MDANASETKVISKPSMCIIYIAKNVHPDWPLIIAANRDEFLSRPTKQPHWWPEARHLFAGKDLRAGGTWLGYNRQHRVAGITNLRQMDLYHEGAKSRGELVKHFLDIDTESTEAAISEFTGFLDEFSNQYNPFNLLYGDANKLMIFSSVSQIAHEASDGIHSLSNGSPDDIWPKMQRGIDQLSECLSLYPSLEINRIFSLLTDKSLPEKELLPDTGIPKDKEHLLSSIFIPEFNLNGMPYGTRSSSVIWTENNGANEGVFMESRFYN